MGHIPVIKANMKSIELHTAGLGASVVNLFQIFVWVSLQLTEVTFCSPLLTAFDVVDVQCTGV